MKTSVEIDIISEDIRKVWAAEYPVLWDVGVQIRRVMWTPIVDDDFSSVLAGLDLALPRARIYVHNVTGPSPPVLISVLVWATRWRKSEIGSDEYRLCVDTLHALMKQVGGFSAPRA